MAINVSIKDPDYPPRGAYRDHERGRIRIPCGRIALIFIIAILAGYLLSSVLQTNRKSKQSLANVSSYRLPRNILPSQYVLKIKMYLPSYKDVPPEKKLTFDGQLELAMQVHSPTRMLALNSKGLTFHSYVLEQDGRTIGIKDMAILKEYEQVHFSIDEELTEGSELRFRVEYSGVIASKILVGLYQTVYTVGDVKKVAVVSQFESTFARLAVPCFDEPDMKAIWNVTIIHPVGTKALSNNKELETKTDQSGNWLTSTFEVTPVMSSYLAAMFVSEFAFVEKMSKNQIRFRIWSNPESKHKLKYALEIGIRCLDFLEDFFGIKFPLSKQDMIAIPDFETGAMENWGMITYREAKIIYDEAVYSVRQRQGLRTTVAHELAHQWFGNLVTMKWWDDLWLNEGFAAFMEHNVLEGVTGDPVEIDNLILEKLEIALREDSTASSHPLSFKVVSPSDAQAGFSAVTYKKGASVIRMIQKVMGNESFREGLQFYLRKFSYKNARADDLWESLGTAISGMSGPNGQPLVMKTFAEQWTTQMGYPMITVRALNSTMFELTQSRYKKHPAGVEKAEYRFPKYCFKWDVPIWYQIDSGETKFAWMSRNNPLHIAANTQISTLVVNVARNGFYRQNYDDDGWDKVAARLRENPKVYCHRTRCGIISDAFAAADIGAIPYTTVFKVLEYLEKEKEYLPWQTAINGLNYIKKYFVGTAGLDLMKSYIVDVVTAVYEENFFEELAQTYKDDLAFAQSSLQSTVIKALCSAGSVACTSKFHLLFREHVLNKCNTTQASQCIRIGAPLRGGTYCYGIMKFGEDAFNTVMELFKRETVQIERENLLSGLACTSEEKNLERILRMVLNQEFFRLQDVPVTFSLVAGSKTGSKMIVNYFINNWSLISRSLEGTKSMLAKVISTCLSKAHTEEQLQQVKDLMNRDAKAASHRAFAKQVDGISHRIEWKKKNFEAIMNYLKNRRK
ncbi:hypothetical protein Q1695_004291 [Nippostrongylus brasiliensis]|nr:hypothetical protein Q1695_004291 [Nippostrongylus brasiliensis]